jgi:hypothetical protein
LSCLVATAGVALTASATIAMVMLVARTSTPKDERNSYVLGIGPCRVPLERPDVMTL